MRGSRLLGNVAGLTLTLGVCAIPLIVHPATAQAPNAAKTPVDLSDPKIIDEGKHLFAQNCTHYCHGREGGAARAPKLRGRNLDSDYVHTRITNGTPNGMPAFGQTMPEETIWKLVAYVVSISKAADR